MKWVAPPVGSLLWCASSTRRASSRSESSAACPEATGRFGPCSPQGEQAISAIERFCSRAKFLTAQAMCSFCLSLPVPISLRMTLARASLSPTLCGSQPHGHARSRNTKTTVVAIGKTRRRPRLSESARCCLRPTAKIYQVTSDGPVCDPTVLTRVVFQVIGVGHCARLVPVKNSKRL